MSAAPASKRRTSRWVNLRRCRYPIWQSSPESSAATTHSSGVYSRSSARCGEESERDKPSKKRGRKRRSATQDSRPASAHQSKPFMPPQWALTAYGDDNTEPGRDSPLLKDTGEGCRQEESLPLPATV